MWFRVTMLRVYVPFASIVAVAFALYTIKSVDLRSLLSTAIFGPVTLLRPLVIAGGALAAGVGTSPSVQLASLFAAGAMLAVEPVVGRCYTTMARFAWRPGAVVGVARHG